MIIVNDSKKMTIYKMCKFTVIRIILSELVGIVCGIDAMNLLLVLYNVWLLINLSFASHVILRYIGCLTIPAV